MILPFPGYIPLFLIHMPLFSDFLSSPEAYCGSWEFLDHFQSFFSPFLVKFWLGKAFLWLLLPSRAFFVISGVVPAYPSGLSAAPANVA